MSKQLRCYNRRRRIRLCADDEDYYAEEVKPLPEPEPVLPYDYEVEYLESTGTQYIDTGVEGNWSDGLIVELDMLLPQGYSDEVDFFGASTNSRKFNYAGCFPSLNNNFVLQLHTPYVRYGVNDYNRHIHIYNSDTKKIIYDNNIVEAITLGWNVRSESNFWLFLRSGMTHPPTSILYSAKFTRNNVLIRDLIPVVKDDVGYMYDKVSGELFGNAGTGEFVIGPKVEQTRSINRIVDTPYSVVRENILRVQQEELSGTSSPEQLDEELTIELKDPEELVLGNIDENDVIK